MRSFFDGTRPGCIMTSASGEWELPALYFRDDSFQAMFTADLDKLRAAMPSDRLSPIVAGRGRGLLGIGAFNYLETSAEPYGEVGVVVPVVHGRRAVPFLPALLDSIWPGYGLVVLHLPVTRRLARDAGRDVWGFTKFLADMQFQNTPEFQECRLEEGGDHILTLQVVKRGIPVPDGRPAVLYSVKENALVRTTIPQRAVTRFAYGAGGSSLVLGETHPVARSIRELGVELRPVSTRYFLDRTAILPEGEVIERDVRPLDGYLGGDREVGERHAVHERPPMIH